jgi:zinc protease
LAGDVGERSRAGSGRGEVMAQALSGGLSMIRFFRLRTFAGLLRPAALAAFMAAALGGLALPAEAARIQRVVSPGGITAWLIESHTLPLLRISVAFKGGSSQDPVDKPGVANFAEWMMNEGVGDMNTAQFFRAKKLLGAAEAKQLTAERQIISFTALSENRDASIELFRQMLVAPRFDDDAMARARAEISDSIEALRLNPANNILNELFGSIFPGHPYGIAKQGTLASVAAITRQDLENYRRATFARDNLSVAVVGDIDAATLGIQLDKLFGGLPAHAQIQPVPVAVSGTPRLKTTIDNVRQTNVAFGYAIDTPLTSEDMPGLAILNHILSGGILSSRLDREIRVKRGLVYSIGFSVTRTPRNQYAYGSFGAEPGSAEQAYELAREEIRKLAEEGPTPEEVRDAKSYLQGAYVVGLSNSAGLVSELLELQRFGSDLDGIDSYAARVEAVTPEQLRKLAKQIFKPDAISRIVVGPPAQADAGGNAKTTAQ